MKTPKVRLSVIFVREFTAWRVDRVGTAEEIAATRKAFREADVPERDLVIERLPANPETHAEVIEELLADLND